MSLILEALKKSEAKRRLGEAPDLGTPFTAPKRRGNLLPLLLVGIVAAGGFGWWFLRQPAPDARTTTAADKAAPKTLTIAPNPPPAAPTAVRTQPVVQAQAPTPPVTQPPAPSPPSPPKTALPAMPQDASKFVAMGGASLQKRGGPMQPAKLPPNMHRVQPETPAKIAAAQPTPTAGARNVATVGAPASANTPAPAKAPTNADVKGAAPATDAPVLAKAPKTADMRGLTPPGDPTIANASQPAKNDTPFYYELPFNVRKSLPTLRLSMHVYAGDPKQRFVILNDSRLGEGDKTADDVTLREVRKDGAVLEFQGQRFFYPRDSL